MQRIWVLCKHFGSIVPAFFGGQLPGHGIHCPRCGSSWKQNQIIAITDRTHSSGMLRDARSVEVEDIVRVIWLKP